MLVLEAQSGHKVRKGNIDDLRALAALTQQR